MVDQMYSNYPANKIMTLVAGDTFWVMMVVLDLCINRLQKTHITYHFTKGVMSASNYGAQHRSGSNESGFLKWDGL